jgi:hypothetical protein
MGKGGDKEVKTQKAGKKGASASSEMDSGRKMDSVEKTYKLSDMATEELKKWAIAYGITGVSDRIELLKELVILCPTAFYCSDICNVESLCGWYHGSFETQEPSP